MICRHTEHAIRGDGRYGRYFEGTNDSNGSWELCHKSKAPMTCLYCDGEGNSSAGGHCGFCAGGKPLDTQKDWDNSWGKVGEAGLKYMLAMQQEVVLSEEDQDKIADLIKKAEELTNKRNES